MKTTTTTTPMTPAEKIENEIKLIETLKENMAGNSMVEQSCDAKIKALKAQLAKLS